MFGMRLALKRLPDGRLALTIPLLWRLALAGIGLVILVSLLAVAPESAAASGDRPGLFAPANAPALLVCAVLFLGALYRERWLFEREADRLTSQFGTTFLHRDRRYRISDLRRVELSRFVRGRPGPAGADASGAGRTGWGRPVLVLALELSDGRVLRLEAGSAGQRARLENLGSAVAAYCGLPFVYSGS